MRFTSALAMPVFCFHVAESLRRQANSTSSDDRWTIAVMECPSGTAPLTTQSMTIADYDAVYASIARLYNGLGTTCNARFCPQADWSGCVLRATGHDFMDFDGADRGGSDGCLDLHDPDNKGLHECLYTGDHGVSVLDAYKEHCTKISLADFLVIAGESVMHLSRSHVLSADRRRPPVDFKSRFKYGRTTASTCGWARGLLPDPEESCTIVEKTFVERMGLTWRQTAALMGVHTLGRARVENSGYNGFWSDVKNARLFNNDFFISALDKGWMPESVDNNPRKNQWRRSDLGADDANLGKEMMLNTDLCLAYTQDRYGGRDLDASDPRQCCAWRFASDVILNPPGNNYYMGEEHCGTFDTIDNLHGFGLQRSDCCNGEGPFMDCGDAIELMGPAFESMRDFAQDEAAWIKEFYRAWDKATSNGFSNLKTLRRR